MRERTKGIRETDTRLGLGALGSWGVGLSFIRLENRIIEACNISVYQNIEKSILINVPK